MKISPLYRTARQIQWLWPLLLGISASSAGQHISCLGRIEPGERVLKIAAPSGSIVSELLVERGQSIEAGHIIASLRDAPVYEARVEYARHRRAMAEAELNRIRAGERPEAVRAQKAMVAALEAEIRLMDLRLERHGALLQDKYISQDSFDELISQQGVIKARIQRERSILESLQSGRTEDVVKAGIDIHLAQARLEEAQAELALQYIRSPIKGTVLDIHAWPGESVGDEGTLIRLGDTRNMMVLAEVYESDLSRVKVGQRATFRSHAFEGEMEGHVKEIYWVFEQSRIFPLDPAAHADRRTVTVRIQPDHPDRLATRSQAHVIVTIKAQ